MTKYAVIIICGIFGAMLVDKEVFSPSTAIGFLVAWLVWNELRDYKG